LANPGKYISTKFRTTTFRKELSLFFQLLFNLYRGDQTTRDTHRPLIQDSADKN